MARPATDRELALRRLPSMDDVLRDPRIARWFASPSSPAFPADGLPAQGSPGAEERAGPVRGLDARAGRVAPRAFVQELAAAELAAWRAEIKDGHLSAAAVDQRLARGELAERVAARLEHELGRGVIRAVNASGVVLNTGLGRAPVHPEVAEVMRAAAESYCVLEVDRWSGERNQRDDYLSELVRRVTGAEAAIGVNNNAGAVLLAFNTFAGGRSAIASRGELVEIGGSFRVPSVMERANVRLVEVGTTNRTRIADYAAAITEDTGLLVKVHTSNFRVVGFTEETSAAELAALGRERGIASVYDLGSGLLEYGDAPLSATLGGEPLVVDALASGVDVVLFSGDKLIGGPQAGILAGRASAVASLRKNPLYRALRLDKVALAGLEKTFELVLAGRGPEIPARAMLLLGGAELRERAERVARALSRHAALSCEVRDGGSQPGSGSAPGVLLPTSVVRVRHADLGAGALAARLRAAPVPVFTRVAEDAVWLDPRTLLPGDEARLLASFEAVVAAGTSVSGARADAAGPGIADGSARAGS